MRKGVKYLKLYYKYEIFNLFRSQTEASVPQKLTQVKVLVLFWNDLPLLPS